MLHPRPQACARSGLRAPCCALPNSDNCPMELTDAVRLHCPAWAALQAMLPDGGGGVRRWRQTCLAACRASSSAVRAMGTPAAVQSHCSGCAPICRRTQSLTGLLAAAAYGVLPSLSTAVGSWPASSSSDTLQHRRAILSDAHASCGAASLAGSQRLQLNA